MTNKIQAGQQDMITVNVACSHPATPASGDPVRFGEKCGMATSPEDTAGKTVIDITRSIVTVSVKGVTNSAANSAVAVGDVIYYNDGHTPVLDKDTSGVKFGMALATVGSGLTVTVKVLKYGW